MDLIDDIEGRQRGGRRATASSAKARDLQRKGQFYIDFVVAENSMGFHADQYSMKSLAEAINMCREGQWRCGESRCGRRGDSRDQVGRRELIADSVA